MFTFLLPTQYQWRTTLLCPKRIQFGYVSVPDNDSSPTYVIDYIRRLNPIDLHYKYETSNTT